MTSQGAQRDLFGDPVEAAPIVEPGAVTDEVQRVTARLPKNLHFGTSSWSFPGWVGIVYAQMHEASTLARFGLSAYARHPLLNAVNLDSTFYRPPTVAQLARYRADVPPHFRFIAKAYLGLTTTADMARARRSAVEPVFLDAGFAERNVIAPLVEGLGETLGAILFQFSPLGAGNARQPRPFIEQLRGFLRALPKGPTYAVELRDPEILGARYEGVLAETGAVHCASVHSRMPPVDAQVGISGKGPLLIRWMLRAGDDYERAGARFAPFNRLAEPDKLSRSRIASLMTRGMSAGRDVYVIAANNAEGCAPLTLLELAKTFTVH